MACLPALAVACAIALPGCQAPPAALPHSAGAPAVPPAAEPVAAVSAQQAVTLENQGFARTEEGWELPLSGKLLFDFDSDVLDETDLRAIERIGKTLRAAGIERLRVEGHTDTVGDPAYNERLSLRRAQAVARALAAAGLQADNISVRGYGPNRPVAANASSAGRSENRRAAIVVPAQ